MLEKDIEKHFVKTVKSLGGISYKFRSVNQRGVCDRIACFKNASTWFVELKKPGGRLSELQKIFAQQMHEQNQSYICLWTIEQIDEWAQGIRYGLS